jgi:hypothetical protein
MEQYHTYRHMLYGFCVWFGVVGLILVVFGILKHRETTSCNGSIALVCSVFMIGWVKINSEHYRIIKKLPGQNVL